MERVMTMAWHDQQKRWRVFEDWERERLRVLSDDYGRALEWMTDAWELASRMSPAWGSEEEARLRWRQLAEIQRSLTQAFLRP